MTPDQYKQQCAAQGCEPCCETMAALVERETIVRYLRVRSLLDKTAAEGQVWRNIASVIERGEYET